MREYSDQEIENKKKIFQQFLHELKAVHYKELKDLPFERIAGITVILKQVSLDIHSKIPKNIRAAIQQQWDEMFLA
jgi:hypothetical protein